jgi:threonine dehydrogenase-like Zn-dependent dehydrogenase
MIELTYLKKGALAWREAPEPALQSPNEALVRPFVAARCDGDRLPLFYSATALLKLGVAVHRLDPAVFDVFGASPYAGPFPFGHECVAEVMATGGGVKLLKRGDRVVVPWAISCGNCPCCSRGLTSRCRNAGKTPLAAYGFGSALGGWGGAVCDSLRIPFADAMLVKIPPGVDPVSVASAGDNISDAWRAVAPQLEANPGAPVLILGGAARSIALYAAGIAVALGSSRVDYLDSSRERLEIAARVGANPLEIPAGNSWFRKHAPRLSGNYGISVDATGTAAGICFALRSLAPGGTATAVAYYFERGVALPLFPMYINSATLHVGVSHARAAIPHVLQLVQQRQFDPSKITTVRASWQDAPAAFLEDTTKVVVERPPLLAPSTAL